MNKLRAWYAGLQSRERRAVALGGAALIALIVGSGMLSLQTAAWSAVHRTEARREDLKWMQANAPEIRAFGGQIPAETGEAPVVLVDRVAREAGLASALRGTQPNGTGVRVQLEAAPFDTMVAWLATLEDHYGLAIESITVDRTAQPGAVNASITFAQPHR